MKVLAQLTSSRAVFTLIAFSFGWVAYSFHSLISVVSDERHPAKLTSVETG